MQYKKLNIRVSSRVAEQTNKEHLQKFGKIKKISKNDRA